MIASPWPLVAGAIITVAAGFSGGYTLKSRLADAEIARIQAAHAQEREAAAREVAARFVRAQDAEQAAARALHATKARLAATERRLKDALYSLDPGRCGLSGPARGLLNDAIAASGGAGLPARAAQPAGAAAAPAADTGHGTGERDVALWIADAIGQYEECRARIDAIRAWDAGAFTGAGGVSDGR